MMLRHLTDPAVQRGHPFRVGRAFAVFVSSARCPPSEESPVEWTSLVSVGVAIPSRASGAIDDWLVLWDYHVISVVELVTATETVLPGDTGNGKATAAGARTSTWWVVDADSRLRAASGPLGALPAAPAPLPPTATPLLEYVRYAFFPHLTKEGRESLNVDVRRSLEGVAAKAFFRFVPAADYFATFCSDRAHMRKEKTSTARTGNAERNDEEDEWQSPPPDYPCIEPPAAIAPTLRHGARSNLCSFINSANSGVPGVVIPHDRLLAFVARL